MAGETELKQMVKRIIDLANLLAEAERQTLSEQKKKRIPEDKRDSSYTSNQAPSKKSRDAAQ